MASSDTVFVENEFLARHRHVPEAVDWRTIFRVGRARGSTERNCKAVQCFRPNTLYRTVRTSFGRLVAVPGVGVRAPQRGAFTVKGALACDQAL